MVNSGFSRRQLIQLSAFAATGLATAGLYRYFRGGSEQASIEDIKTEITPEPVYRQRKKILKHSIHDTASELVIDPKEITAYKHITNYNNFYEFSTDKQAVASAASKWKIQDWKLEVTGLVEKPLSLNLQDLYNLPSENRVYRFRCVEGWSMVIPWNGFPLAALLELARPTTNAKYVAFESYFNDEDMPNASRAGLPFPYVEGLRLDEALHPLTLMATGIYDRRMPNQNGAPIRLVVPWKYGFKSIKSVVKIKLTDQEPPTTWNLANGREYGFYSNVNPAVDHPRWSQKRERRIGELGLRDTLMFNGYEKQVAHLYQGMDLRKYY